MKPLKNIIIFTILIQIFLIKIPQAKLLSFQSEYDISLGKTDAPRLPNRTYVDKASGYLLIDWINNCEKSWITTQRMMTRFVNSHGVGTVSEINYSLNELINEDKMEFVLEIKEDAEIVDRHYGTAEKNEKVIVKFLQKDEILEFSKDVIFPHSFLEEIIRNFDSEKDDCSKCLRRYYP